MRMPYLVLITSLVLAGAVVKSSRICGILSIMPEPICAERLIHRRISNLTNPSPTKMTLLCRPVQAPQAGCAESKSVWQNQPNLNRPKEELEEYPLESLKMVGYLYQTKLATPLFAPRKTRYTR